MTTSPTDGTPQPSVAASGSPAAPSSVNVLLEKRASSIGWYFIELYYGFFNDGIDNIHKVYHPQASVSHSAFPNESSDRVIEQAVGIEAIKKRFSQVEPAQNKIVITSADIQVCLQDKILIVVYGEWSRNGGPFWQFSQTFLLCPGKRENILDLANDVLRFVDYELFSAGAETAEEEKVVEKPAEKEPAAEDEKTVEQAEKPVEKTEQVQVNGEKGPEKIKTEKPVAIKDQEPQHSEAAEPVVSGSSAEPDASDKTINSRAEDSETPEASEDKGPLTWAALAATAKETKAQASSKAASKKAPAATISSPPTTSVPTAPAQSASGKYKKEDWFPIYIRGVKDVDENTLRDHLTKNFGPIKFLKPSMNIALCDFQDAESQRRALNAKETVVDGISILLEVRELKANVKAFKAQKEKADLKKKVDKKTPKKKGRD